MDEPLSDEEGSEAQVDALDVLVDARQGLGDGVCADALDRWVERAQTVEFHGLSLGDELLRAVHDVLEHQHQHLVGGQLSVLGQVSGEALQRQGFLGLYLVEVGTVVLGGGNLALAQIHQHGNNVSCHNFC